MGEPKTAPSQASVTEFLAAVTDPRRRADAEAVCALMSEVTGAQPVMWGPSIIGFGSYHYKYASGREGDAAAVGFSPRKGNLALYGLTYAPESARLLARLGKHKTSVACLYVNKLADINLDVLKELIELGYRTITATDPESFQS